MQKQGLVFVLCVAALACVSAQNVHDLILAEEKLYAQPSEAPVANDDFVADTTFVQQSSIPSSRSTAAADAAAKSAAAAAAAAMEARQRRVAAQRIRAGIGAPTHAEQAMLRSYEASKNKARSLALSAAAAAKLAAAVDHNDARIAHSHSANVQRNLDAALRDSMRAEAARRAAGNQMMRNYAAIMSEFAKASSSHEQSRLLSRAAVQAHQNVQHQAAHEFANSAYFKQHHRYFSALETAEAEKQRSETLKNLEKETSDLVKNAEKVHSAAAHADTNEFGLPKIRTLRAHVIKAERAEQNADKALHMVHNRLSAQQEDETETVEDPDEPVDEEYEHESEVVMTHRKMVEQAAEGAKLASQAAALSAQESLKMTQAADAYQRIVAAMKVAKQAAEQSAEGSKVKAAELALATKAVSELAATPFSANTPDKLAAQDEAFTRLHNALRDSHQTRALQTVALRRLTGHVERASKLRDIAIAAGTEANEKAEEGQHAMDRLQELVLDHQAVSTVKEMTDAEDTSN